uniref:Uncharacterized protein n=1 Tax=Malurus cyaneus samueli TaxID=2593467 RepID=A0A8C5TZW4_9PASS
MLTVMHLALLLLEDGDALPVHLDRDFAHIGHSGVATVLVLGLHIEVGQGGGVGAHFGQRVGAVAHEVVRHLVKGFVVGVPTCFYLLVTNNHRRKVMFPFNPLHGHLFITSVFDSFCLVPVCVSVSSIFSLLSLPSPPSVALSHSPLHRLLTSVLAFHSRLPVCVASFSC